MIIIAITGTIGAGKGTVVQYFLQHGFSHYSARAFLYEEIDRRGLSRDRDSLNVVGESLRKEHGAAYVIEQLAQRAQKIGSNAVIESIRTIGEVQVLKKMKAQLIAVDANPRTRYERAVQRASETDNVSFEKFMAQEEREANGTDPGTMNIRACIDRADFKLSNDGSIEDLHRQLDSIFATLIRSHE